MRKLLSATIINNGSRRLKNYLYLVDKFHITEIEKRTVAKRNVRIRKIYKSIKRFNNAPGRNRAFVVQTSALAERVENKFHERFHGGEGVTGVPSGDVIIYTRHYTSAGSRGNIVQDIPRIHYARKRRGGGRREKGWSS